MNVLVAAVRIKLPAEAAAVLSVLGGLFVIALFALWFFGKFGKKGVIVAGIVGGLALAVVGGFAFKRHLEDARWKEARHQKMTENLEVLRATAARSPDATAPLAATCANQFRSDRYDQSFDPIVLARAPQQEDLEVFVREFGPVMRFTVAAGPLPEVGALPYGLEDGLRPQLMFVVGRGTATQTEGRWSSTLPVTIIEAATKKRCSGLVSVRVASQGDEPAGETLISEICSQNSWRCGRS